MFLLPLNSRGRGHGNQGFKAGSEEEITAPPHHLLNALKKKKKKKAIQTWISLQRPKHVWMTPERLEV